MLQLTPGQDKAPPNQRRRRVPKGASRKKQADAEAAETRRAKETTVALVRAESERNVSATAAEMRATLEHFKAQCDVTVLDLSSRYEALKKGKVERGRPPLAEDRALRRRGPR